MSRLSLDTFPVEIFQIIHSYVTDYEYRQFINCHKLFESIKYETIYYDLLEIHAMKKKMIWKFGKKENSLVKYLKEIVSNNIKDKRKQIKMKIQLLSEKEIFLYNDLYSGVHYLAVSFARYGDSFNKISFKNVFHLEIKGSSSLTTLDSFDSLENLTELRLAHLSKLTDISCLQHLKSTLKSVKLEDCAKLKNISVLKNIPAVSLVDCCSISDLSLLGNHDEFEWFDYGEVSITMDSLIPFKSAKRLSVEGCIVSFQGLKDALTEELSAFNLSSTYIVFPGYWFELVSLELTHFGLSSLKKGSLSKLRIVTLTDCLISCLSVFSCVRIMELIDIKLEKESNSVLDFLDCTNLRKMRIQRCRDIVEIRGLFSVKRLEIHSCRILKKISGLHQVTCLVLSCCPDLRDINDFSGTLKYQSVFH
jgi:hypothetical protein